MVASERRVVKAMSWVPVVAVAAVVQANAWFPALTCLSTLSMSLLVPGHATRCLPAHLRMVALRTVDHD